MVYWEAFFADPRASSSAPYPQELNQWNASSEEPLHSSTVEKSERPEQNRDLRCQSGPSAEDSVIFFFFFNELRSSFSYNSCKVHNACLKSDLCRIGMVSEPILFE